MKQTYNSTEELLSKAPVGKLIAHFAIPGITAMLVNALYNIVDQIFIGRSTGYLGNAAANVVLLITMLTLALSLLTGDGAAAYYSLKLGSNEKEAARKGVACAVIFIFLTSFAAMAAGLIWLKPLLRLLGCTNVILPYAMDYGYIVMLGIPFIMISTSINSIIRADGSPKYAMVSMITGAVINACFDPIFIFVLGWGIKGAAASSFLGQLVSFIMSVSYLRRMKNIRLIKKEFLIDPGTLRQILSLGISSFIDQISFTVVMAVNNNLIVYYGKLSQYGSEIPLTSYGISMKVQEILFTILLGTAIGMQPIVGYNYGAGNYSRVKKAYLTAISIGTVISIGASILFIGFPEHIIRIFGSAENTAYVDFSVRFFRTYFLLYPVFGFQTITGVFFQAIGKPKQASAISISYQLIFKVGAALVLSGLVGLSGILWSGPAADLMAFILSAVLIVMEFRKLT